MSNDIIIEPYSETERTIYKVYKVYNFVRSNI